MFCVIQQVRLKKANRFGAYQKLVAERDGWTINGKPPVWRYSYTGERFERPHLEAYKISIHQSYRDGGRVRKHQYSIRTISYYDIVEFGLYDCAISAIKAVSKRLGVNWQTLYKLIDSKLEPLRQQIEAEFYQTEEYQTNQRRQKIIHEYQKSRAAFCTQYGVDADEYNRCFDVFGTLRNEEYLKQIQREHKNRQKAEREARRRQRQFYREQFSSGSYSPAASGNYTTDETAMLRQFYKVLSKKYHPDLNPGKDTTAEMQLLNRLKQVWGI